jgi:hypothetical protein
VRSSGLASIFLGASMIAFDSLNPYDTMGFVVGNDPQDLINQLRAIRTPIKIHFIVPYGSRHAAYFTGDVKAKKVESDVITEKPTRSRVRKV